MDSQIIPTAVEKPSMSRQPDFTQNEEKGVAAIVVIDEEEKQILRKIDIQ
jgi:hypothetical protein